MEIVIGLIMMFLFALLVYSSIHIEDILDNTNDIIEYLINKAKYNKDYIYECRKEKRNIIFCIKEVYKEYTKKYGIIKTIIDIIAVLYLLSLAIILILLTAYMLGSIIIEK